MERCADYESYFDGVVLASLRRLSVWLIGIYAGYLAVRYFTWTEGLARTFTLFGVSVQILFLSCLAVSLRREWQVSRPGAIHGALMTWSVSLCSSFHFSVGLEPYYTSITLLALVGSGALLLDLVWTPVTMVVLIATWLTTVIQVQGRLGLQDLLPLISATLLSGALFQHRRQLFHRQFSILESQRASNEFLSQSLQQAQQDQCEYETRSATRAQARDVTLEQLKAEVAARMRLEGMVKEVGQEDPLGRLASGVAHDFANLITILQMNLEDLTTLRHRTIEDRDLLRQALQELDEVNILVQQLLAYSRRQSLSRSVQEADAFLAAFVESLGSLLPENIKIEAHYGASNCPILGDRSQLQQALLNLCLNATDAMPQGGVLKLSSRQQEGQLVLSINDTGQGMDMETLSQARDPYFTTKGFHSGRGLGLSVVDGILNQHDGELLLTSTPGEGTQATIVLPIYHPQKPDTGKVLLVEDDEVTRLLASKYLKICGYQVYEAENAYQAKSIFLECAPYPGLIVTDIVLPDENGITLVEYLTHICPELKVVFTSAQAQLRELPIKNRCSFLSKPYGLAQFKERLESLS